MSTSRRSHPNGPGEEKTALEVLEDLKEYLYSQRAEYVHDAHEMVEPPDTDVDGMKRYIKDQAQLKGQLATIRIALAWIKDRKKHLKGASAPLEKRTDWNAKRKAHMKNLWEIRDRMKADAVRIESVVSGLTIDSVKQDEEDSR